MDEAHDCKERANLSVEKQLKEMSFIRWERDNNNCSNMKMLGRNRKNPTTAKRYPASLFCWWSEQELPTPPPPAPLPTIPKNWRRGQQFQACHHDLETNVTLTSPRHENSGPFHLTQTIVTLECCVIRALPHLFHFALISCTPYFCNSKKKHWLLPCNHLSPDWSNN